MRVGANGLCKKHIRGLLAINTVLCDVTKTKEGFEPWDVHVRDLLSGCITLQSLILKLLVGVFSYADVLESARGWVVKNLFNKELKAQFDAFYACPDTSLGICNGCQLMEQLNFVPWKGIEEAKQPRFIQIKCEGAGGEVTRDHASRYGGLHAGRVCGARRGPLLLARRRGEGGGDAPELRGAEVHGRWQRDDGVPDEPERLRGRRGGSDLARRPPPVHDASPRASVHEVPVALLAGGVGEPRVALAEDVPERERVVRASVVCLLNMLNKEATRRGRTCAFSCPYERAAPSRPPDPSPE